MRILLHSSKTMRDTRHDAVVSDVSLPPLLHDAHELASYLKTLSIAQIKAAMRLSETMAKKTYETIQQWDEHASTLPAIDIFLGDIYSGLQAKSLTEDDRAYAHDHLYILSGLYGILRALDGIQPYRLEMGYTLPGPAITNLYTYWGDRIAQALPVDNIIVNLSAVEYTKAVFPHLKKIKAFDDVPIITPKFLTVSPKTGEPTFVTVHAKIARGAFARWMIVRRVETPERLIEFSDLGYRYDASLSTPSEPAFVAEQFEGIGLSVRLDT